MTFDELETAWAKDAPIDLTDLLNQNANIPRLHAKYLRIMRGAETDLRKIQAGYKKLYSLKREFLINPNKEMAAKYGWEMNNNRILRGDVDKWLEQDDELIEAAEDMGNKIAMVEYVKEIMKELARRSFHLKNIIEERKFLNGN